MSVVLQPNDIPILDWVLIALLSLLWGSSFLFNEIALRELPLFTIVACRLTLATCFLGILAGRKDTRQTPDTQPVSFARLTVWARVALLNNVIPLTLIVWAQQTIEVGLAAILNALTPFAALLLAHWLTDDEVLTFRKVAGIGIGIAGVILLIGPSVLLGLGEHAAAQIACICAAISYAYGGLYARKAIGNTREPIRAALCQLAAAAIITTPIALAIDQPWYLSIPALAVITAVIGSAVLSTALAYVIYYRVLPTSGAGNLLLVTLLIPVSAGLLAWLVLEETPSRSQLIANVIIMLGLVVVDGRLFRQLRPCRNSG